MTTVKEFKDLGVEFVEGDERSSSVKGHGDVHMSADMVCGTNKESKTDHESIVSFAWRSIDTLSDNPKYCIEINADKSMWRPLLDQSSQSKPYDFDEHVSEAKPVLTQAMAYMQHELWLHKANSELLATLTEFMVKNNIGNAGESCIDVAIRELSEKHGIDSRTPKQKAVDELAEEIESSSGGSYSELAEHLINVGYEKKC